MHIFFEVVCPEIGEVNPKHWYFVNDMNIIISIYHNYANDYIHIIEGMYDMTGICMKYNYMQIYSEEVVSP